ncbi:MAG: hypothetical protein NTZ79_16975, partial [Proteobacteria bacterium]|nr:hypothetical protein [Pseudomonadota bacterium]
GFRTAANQAGGAGFRGEVWVTYTPATVIATGADPAATTIAPGAAATDVDLFTFQTSNGTDTITSITVNLSTASGIGLLAITNNANTVLGSTASPVAGANVIALGTNITATTTATTYKVRVTPLSHAAMLTVPGGSYDITAPVTNWVGTNAQVGSDTNANALTIDNLSPAGATATSGTPGNANVTLNWTTSASADFNTTSGSVLLRWTSASAGAEVPAEGTTYAAGNTIGTAFVACVISSAASTALARINGTGGSAGCNTTALTNGTDYTYKIFQKDTNGNYDTGVLIGTFRPSLTTTLATGADPAAATIAPGAAATDADLFTFQTNVGTETITSITLNLSTNSGIGLLAITNNANTVLGSTASPVAGTNVIPLGTNITATTTATTYKVRVTPLSHAAMPAPPGGSYDINATVTAWAGTNTIHAGSDTDNNALTIDNLSPASATATSGTAGVANVTLNWTTSASADFNTTGGSVLLRWTSASAGTEVPAEGATYAAGNTIGTAFVACVISSAASTALVRLNGTGGSAGCSTTALTNGTAYTYKIFQLDTRGNYDTGVSIGTFTPNLLAAPTVTKSFNPTSIVATTGTSTLTVTITNPNTSAINGLAFTDTYPS